MAKGLSNLNILNKAEGLELVLELNSFSGGENTIGADHELKNNEARSIENWEATSLGGMIRAKGFTQVASGGATYTDAPDLLIEHLDEVYAVIEGDLAIKSSASLAQEDAAAFTSGELCHGVSANGDLWITNDTDNLKYKTNSSGAIASPTDDPATACERIYEMNSRLIAEGNSANTVYGSRAGAGNWKGAGGWSTSNDSWSMTFPEGTKGCVPGFPSGTELTVFTEKDTFVVYNQPGVARRRIVNGRGCAAPLSIAKGDEGVFFVSNYPSLGVYVWNSVNYINLTENCDFVDSINLSGRIFGVYRDRKYFLFYNESGSGVSYPNRLKIYDTKHGRWYTRSINSDVADNFGYPALLPEADNLLYVASSRQDVVYELEDASTSDNANDTEADYATKVFTSKDFYLPTGAQFPLDMVRLKLIKIDVTVKGNTGNVVIAWDINRGSRTGTKTFSIDEGVTGDLINTTFTINSSSIVEYSDLVEKVKRGTFANSAVGREFKFNIINSGTGARTEIRKVRIHAICMEDL